ncbi:SigB/SigF/SigG family RNA polymerase sigma factor [Natronoglycomyces albus]|uniref:SigB/SigF/SigG family RNA polymerase sigma factor n=1 Tax=Natronoglycomyces albus TaxID=2811108 RepID=A0A895XWS9_9ACTN|nr:SigB/SigF/SigG family RNA polymerase sigma factor [Natronoglycomyces albus]QSB06088.1 SigB/SigF/SigG family RNA polymerase sigma factor [Natronoglycomyces albus]
MIDRCQKLKRRAHSARYEHLRPLFYELAGLPPEDPRRSRLREELVTGFIPVAENIAGRFAGRGVPRDDLEQVAAVGLIHAIDRFDPHRGTNFLSYAIPTMTGEVRRYFRDCTWTVRVPRRVKELYLLLNQAEQELTQRLGYTANVSELARYLDISEQSITETLAVCLACRAESLDAPPRFGREGATLADRLGSADQAIEDVDNHETLMPLLHRLPQRERRILALRFVHELTQTQIAEQVGLSQMHVSRLLEHALKNLRVEMVDA